MTSTATETKRKHPVGAEVLPEGGVHFRVWAPQRKQVEVVIVPESGDRKNGMRVELQSEQHGYFSGLAADARAGMLYGFRLDGGEDLRPDPASRFQPSGPSGLSMIVDPTEFNWTDQAWGGLTSRGQVIYEMHIGTFTSQGIWSTAARELPELKRLGITTIEVMPIADFPGKYGWGYDGVCMFAPTRLYGAPDDFRRFVDSAHATGIAVILDVVYNHFGVSENWIWEFSPHYKTDRYENEWSDAINFDDTHSDAVRDFFIANAKYWIEEFHLDGFRFDATQAIQDASQSHILGMITTAARKAAGKKPIYCAAENEPQDVISVAPPDKKGHGMDAAWNDDFHHAAMVRLTGHNPAYYSDYLGSAEELASAIKRGFLYQGQYSQWQEKPRGTPTTGLPATAFVSFLQNHDQVANSATGERIHQLTSAGRLRAMTALWLLAPQTPLFLQGQEFAASTPFLYFANFTGDLGKAVAAGRAKFLSQFPNLATEESQSALIDPMDIATFERCRLDFKGRETNKEWYLFHQDLLRMRREDEVFSQERADWLETAVISSDCLLARYFGGDGNDRLVLVNFGTDFHVTPAPHPLLAPPAGKQWEQIWSSAMIEYGGAGAAPSLTDDGWHLGGESAVVLKAVPAKATAQEKE
jgi:maltooligosyltrehalose trehalohydrolase